MQTSAQINVTGALRGLDRVRAGVPNAVARALNRAVVSGRAVLVRSVAQDLGIQQQSVKDAVQTRLATPQDPTAQLRASAARLPLYAFSARQTRAGVTARLGTRHVYPHAFIAQMSSGHVGVFARRGRGRLPIDELLGPSVAHVCLKYRVATQQRAAEALLTNLISELRFLTQKV